MYLVWRGSELKYNSNDLNVDCRELTLYPLALHGIFFADTQLIIKKALQESKLFVDKDKLKNVLTRLLLPDLAGSQKLPFLRKKIKSC